MAPPGCRTPSAGRDGASGRARGQLPREGPTWDWPHLADVCSPGAILVRCQASYRHHHYLAETDHCCSLRPLPSSCLRRLRSEPTGSCIESTEHLALIPPEPSQAEILATNLDSRQPGSRASACPLGPCGLWPLPFGGQVLERANVVYLGLSRGIAHLTAAGQGPQPG